MSETLVHKGSTKDVYLAGCNYLFRFSDRYSVFDYGEMPDHLIGKGTALAKFTKAVYQKLTLAGIRHHIIDSETADNEIMVRPFEVVRDGSPLNDKRNVFLPLEVIFRLGVAKGSSLLKKPGNKFRELEMFTMPMIEFTTKLERFDRPLTHEEAKALSGLNDQEWLNLTAFVTKIALNLKDLFADCGMTIWDGKVELALDEKRNIVLVDSIGPDELRLTKDGTLLSKEIIRQFYKNTDWYQKLGPAKEKHGENFKVFISPPPVLPREFKAAVEDLYSTLADAISAPETAELKLGKIISRLGRFS